MEKLSIEQRNEVLDYFGKYVIENVRDGVLNVSMRTAKSTTVNPIKKEYYKSLEGLSYDQQEAVCDLLSETITDTIYRFLEMFEENETAMELNIIKDGKKYNMTELSEKMGSEIACYEDNGWIQKFSKIGRFIL